MERFSYDLGRAMHQIGDFELLKNPGGAIDMPLFAPWSTAVAMWKARRGDIDLVHLGDALIAPFGVALRRFGDVPVTVTVHGLDMTRETPPGYRQVVPPAVMRLDRVIAVSTATRDTCVRLFPGACRPHHGDPQRRRDPGRTTAPATTCHPRSNQG